MTTKIAKADALALLVHCGFKSAGRWDVKKLAEKLTQVEAVVPDTTPEDPAIAATLKTVLDAIKAKDDFEVTLAEGESPEPEKPAKPAKAEKPAQSAGDKPAKVRPGKTASYCTGVVLKKFGIENGVTPEMIEYYGTLRGKQNKELAEANLVWAWHAIKGYLADPEAEEAAAAPVSTEPTAEATAEPVVGAAE